MSSGMAYPGGEESDVQVAARLRDLETRVEALETRTRRQGGLWVERIMYWLIAIGLIIAIIQLA